MNERELATVGVAASTAEQARASVLWLMGRCSAAPGGAVSDVLRRIGEAAPFLRRLVPAPSTVGCVAYATAGEAVRAVGSAVAVGAAVGGVVDGAYAALDARRENLGTKPAMLRVARGAGAGIVATVAGTGAAVGLVALVGPVAPAGLVVASFAGSVAARTLIGGGR